MVWGCISHDCKLDLVTIQGNLTGDQYIRDVLQPQAHGALISFPPPPFSLLTPPPPFQNFHIHSFFKIFIVSLHLTISVGLFRKNGTTTI